VTFVDFEIPGWDTRLVSLTDSPPFGKISGPVTHTARAEARPPPADRQKSRWCVRRDRRCHLQPEHHGTFPRHSSLLAMHLGLDPAIPIRACARAWPKCASLDPRPTFVEAAPRNATIPSLRSVRWNWMMPSTLLPDGCSSYTPRSDSSAVAPWSHRFPAGRPSPETWWVRQGLNL